MQQLTLTRPTRRVKPGLNERQRSILMLREAYGVRYVTPGLVRDRLGYHDPNDALRRMVARGWLRRAGRGRYLPVRVGERLTAPGAVGGDRREDERDGGAEALPV